MHADACTCSTAQILEERLQRRKAHIKAFYDVIARIQAQTGISDMNTIASQFFSQEEQYDQMVVRLQDQAEQLEELQREEKEIKVHLNKLRVYGAYKGRHSKLDEKDQELQLAEAAARREETLWRGRRRVRGTLFLPHACAILMSFRQSLLGLVHATVVCCRCHGRDVRSGIAAVEQQPPVRRRYAAVRTPADSSRAVHAGSARRQLQRV